MYMAVINRGRFIFALTLLCFLVMKGHAQFLFEPDFSIPVSAGDNELRFPWAGGLNSGQYNTMDLNGDNRDDLVIFDRSAGKVLTYLNVENSRYEYNSHYEHFFPEDVNSWMVLADYDCDGKKDIFTNTRLGIKVYRNISSDLPEWALVADPIFTQGTSSAINLQMNQSDIPAITDLDGDGDLDILVFNFFAGGTIDHHLNRSMEKYGICDSLDFQRVDRNWGKFEECFCGNYAFGQTCVEKNGNRTQRSARTTHAGGKALLALDMDADGDKDILFGEEECEDLVFFENQGTPQTAVILDVDKDFPTAQTRISFPFFPAAYYEDVNFDGVKDLIVAPNSALNPGDLVNFKSSSWLYINTGSNDTPQFEFTGNDFIQNESIDLGENAFPLLIDIDNDGDSDLIVGSKGYLRNDGFYATLFLFENTGNRSNPSFMLVDDDYLGFSSRKLKHLQPFITDYNRDNAPDLLFTGSEEGNNTTKGVFYLPNTASTANTFEFDLNQAESIPFSARINDNLYFVDVDNDGFPDILLGKPTGAIEYYRNNRSNEFILENETFFNIDNDIFRRNPSINTFDLNGDNLPELIVTDGTGNISIYEDFRRNLENPAPPSESVVFNMLSETATNARLGRSSWTAFADLNNDRLADMVVGGVRGGVQLFLNRSEKIVPGEEETGLTLIIYPNPAIDENTVNIESNQPAELSIFNLLGQEIAYLGPVDGNEIFPIDVSTLPNGLYLLRAAGSSGESTQRLLIQR